MSERPAKIENDDSPMFGILNAQGQFWSHRAFDTPVQAKDYIRSFWGANEDMARSCLRTHRVVPVRVQLTELRQGALKDTPPS